MIETSITLQVSDGPNLVASVDGNTLSIHCEGNIHLGIEVPVDEWDAVYRAVAGLLQRRREIGE